MKHIIMKYLLALFLVISGVSLIWAGILSKDVVYFISGLALISLFLFEAKGVKNDR